MTSSTIDATDRHQMFYWQVDRPFDAKQTKEIFLDRYQNFQQDDAHKAVEYGLKQVGFKSADATVVSVSPPGNILSSVNVIYFVTLASGKEVVIRIHPSRVQNGYFWVEKLASHEAKKYGVPSYETYYIDDDRGQFPFDFMIIERLPGQTMQLYWPLTHSLEQSLLEETGEYLANIHKIETLRFGFFDNQIAKHEGKLIGIHQTWREHIYAALSKNLQYLTSENVITASSRKKIESIFTKHEDVLTCSNPNLIQNDLADWNQLSDGSHVTGILDWDECFSGDPVMDFAAWSVFFPFERMKHLINGYKRIRQLPDGYEEKLHVYRLRYIVSKSVSRHMKQVFTPNEKYKEMLDYALKIMEDEFHWYGK